MTAAAFQATFSDWKLIRGRKVVQVVLEVPLEAADQAYTALGGMPDPGKSVWVGVARLNLESEVMPSDKSKQSPETAPALAPEQPVRGRKSFSSLPFAQQAGMLCQDPIFRSFLNEEHNYACETGSDAAEALRERCSVGSRSDLKPNTPSGDKFVQIRDQFIAWKMVSA